MITTLLEENGIISGAVGFKLDREEAVIIKANSVILCTGAGGFAFSGSTTQGALAGETAAEFIKTVELISVSDSKIDEAITEKVIKHVHYKF